METALAIHDIWCCIINVMPISDSWMLLHVCRLSRRAFLSDIQRRGFFYEPLLRRIELTGICVGLDKTQITLHRNLLVDLGHSSLPLYRELRSADLVVADVYLAEPCQCPIPITYPHRIHRYKLLCFDPKMVTARDRALIAREYHNVVSRESAGFIGILFSKFHCMLVKTRADRGGYSSGKLFATRKGFLEFSSGERAGRVGQDKQRFRRMYQKTHPFIFATE